MFPSTNTTGTDGTAGAQLQQQPLPDEEYSSSARPRWKKPKRGMTAYNYFFQEETIRILNEREPTTSSSSSGSDSSGDSGDSINSSISSGSMLRKQSGDSSKSAQANGGACSVCPSCSGEIALLSSPKGDETLPPQTQNAQRQSRPVKEVLNHEESGTLSRLSSSSEDRPSSTTSDETKKKSSSNDKTKKTSINIDSSKSATSSSPSNNGSESGSNNGKESSSSSNDSSSNNNTTKRPPRYVSASSAASSSESNPDSATSIAGSSGADGDISSSEYGGPSSASSSQASTTGGSSSSDDDESRARTTNNNKTKTSSPGKTSSTSKKGEAPKASPSSSDGTDAKGHHSFRKRKMCTCHTRPGGAKASAGTGASVGATTITSSSTRSDAPAAGTKKARVIAPDDTKSIEAKSVATNASTSARSSRSKRKKPHRKISFRDLNQEIAKRWKTVSKEDMARYKAMAEKDAARYREEMKQYQQEKIAAMSMIRGGMLELPTRQSPTAHQGPRVAFQVQQQQLPQQAPAFAQQQQPALPQPMSSNVSPIAQPSPSMQMGLSQDQFSALPSDIQSLLVQYYQMKEAQNKGQAQMQPQQQMTMQAQPGQLGFQQQQQQQQAMPPSGMSQEQMQILSLQQQQAQLMNQLSMLQSGGNTPALGVTPGPSQLASASQSYATLPASNTTGQLQQPPLQNTSNEVFPPMQQQQLQLNTQAQSQVQPHPQATNQQMNAPSFAMASSSNNDGNEMDMPPAVSEQFLKSNAFLQKILEEGTKRGSPGENGAAWVAQARPQAAAATGTTNIHVHHVNLSHQQKQPSSANYNPARRQESCLSLEAQSKTGSDSLNLSDISSNFSISSLMTLTSLKQDGTKKDEVSDISTSGSDEKKKSAGTDSPPESDESGAKQARSRKRQHSEDNEPEVSNKKVRVVDPAALGGKPCMSKRDSGELSSESSWTSSNDDDNNEGGAYFSGMSTAKGLGVVKQQRSYNSEVSSFSASGSDRGSDDGLSKEETSA